MMTIRQQFNRQMSRYFLIGLVLHLPVFIYLAVHNNHDLLANLGICAALLAGPVLLYAMGVSSALLPATIAFTTIGFSGMLIHLGDGMIEMHFHIFIALATFIAFGLITPALVGVVTTALHHLLFFFFLPESVFNYKASFYIVLLHSVFVVLESIPVFFIAYRFKKLIDLQDTTVGQLDGISSQIGQSILTLSSSGQQLSQSSSSAAASLEETVASLEELNTRVQTNTENAKQAAILSNESKASAETGDHEVRSLISSMNQITKSSKKIEEIISVIDDIAFQTNLLALNAAVEAARAGEQGKGFAVVADAVRGLAQKSAEAAKDITSLIKDSVETIEGGTRLADRSGEVLQKILASVKKVSDLNQEIASASQEQSSGIQQISKAMGALDKASQTNAMSSQEVAETANEINKQSEQMKHLIKDLGKQMGMKSAS